MFVEFKTRSGKDTFVVNAFQIISVHKTLDGLVQINTTDTNHNYITSEKYKDVIEKLSTIQ